jgi:hypothetical protein
LKFIVGARGLDSLSFNGESLLASPKSGELQPERSAFRTVLGAVLTLSSAGVATPNKKPNTIELSYPWGRISCAYGKKKHNLAGGRVVFDTRVFPQIIGKFAPLHDHALFLLERVTRNRLCPRLFITSLI